MHWRDVPVDLWIYQDSLRPEQVDLVGLELPVGGEDFQPLQLGLCDEKAVKGIRMMERQAAGVQRMAVLNGQRRGAARFHPGENVLGRRQGEGELSERVLDSDLPRAGGRQEDLVPGILEQGPGLLGQPLRLGLQPQPAVSVEEDSQDWKRASTSSGRGASKSSGTSKSPSS